MDAGKALPTGQLPAVTGKPAVRHERGMLGLGRVRVLAWLPCRLQVYFNGHNWLAKMLRRCGTAFVLADSLIFAAPRG